jgi:hypothetical protein
VNQTLTAPRAPVASRRRTLLALLGLVLLAGLLAGVRWWTHPTYFDDFNGSAVLTPRPVDSATTSMAVTFPATGEESTDDLTLLGAEVHLARNSAAATATFRVCHLQGDEDPVGVAHDLDGFCEDSEPLRHGMAFRRGPAGGEGDYVLLTLEPTRPGEVLVDRVDLEYALGADHLWRRGTERIVLDVLVRVS